MFFYTVPYLAHYSTLIPVVQLIALVVAVLLLIAISVPSRVDRLPNRIILGWDFPYALWYRDVRLWQAFWPCWLALNGVVFLVDTLVKAGIASVLVWDITQLLTLVGLFWWSVAVWHASPNTRRQFWAFLARLVVVLSFLEIAHRIFIRIKFPRDFFGCDELLLNFTSCF